MLANYFKIAFRQLYKNKVFSILNILGLTIGMAAVILLFLWVQHEKSFDDFHAKKDRIYSLWNKAKWGEELMCWDVTPKVAAATIQQNYPEVEKVVRVDWPQNRLFKVDDKRIFSSGYAIDPDFLKVFDFPLVKGNTATIFSNPNTILLTPELADKLFGSQDVMGKTVRLDNNQSLTVTGIVAKPPTNTEFQFEYLIPWSYLEMNSQEKDLNWGNNSTHTYLLLKENTSIEKFQAKIKNLRREYSGDEYVYDMFVYPMEKWRLYGAFKNGVESGGKITLVRLFTIIGIFILLIACINFMNLSTARSTKRAKEVGIRKTVGAARTSLIKQFMGETLIIASISFILALGIVQLVLPFYNKLIDKKLFLDFGNGWFWLYSLSFVAITGILAGSYPAFYLSAFNPLKVLKGTFVNAGARITPRKILVVLQFSVAVLLIIATIVVKKQISHVTQREVGYNRNLLVYHFLNKELDENYSRIKQELLAKNLVVSVTKTSAPITEGWSDTWDFRWEGKDPNDKTDFDRYCVDEDIVTTAGFKLVAGRDFNLQKFATDSSAMIINESALKTMKLKDPVGKIVYDGDVPYHVIGVIKDFILTSPYHPTKPMAILGAKGWFNVINLRLKDNTNNFAQIQQVFKKYNPDAPVDFRFVDQEYAKKFNDMQRAGTLASLFAGLTIFISCLGLFGLASYMAENRVKEIGVRKVLGASVFNIVAMLSSSFLKLVLIAFVITSPLAWWLMNRWLQDYEYRIDLEWWVFALAGALTLCIALVTILSQTLRAATSNPVKSLRTE